jgi:hypothetical protein
VARAATFEAASRWYGAQPTKQVEGDAARGRESCASSMHDAASERTVGYSARRMTGYEAPGESLKDGSQTARDGEGEEAEDHGEDDGERRSESQNGESAEQGGDADSEDVDDNDSSIASMSAINSQDLTELAEGKGGSAVTYACL